MSGSVLDELSIFHGFTPQECDQLRPLFIALEEAIGSIIFEQGSPAEYLYLLVEGEVHVRFKPDDAPPITVAKIRPEGVVGWSAALGSPLYTSSAICMSDCKMLKVRGEDLRLLCEKTPEVGAHVLERLAAVIAQRLRSTHNHVVALLRQGLGAGVSHNNIHVVKTRGD
jgi:CRP/FNR family transcriptional regulator, cyclic AMP receptor protein